MAMAEKTRWLRTILTKPPSSRCENCRGLITPEVLAHESEIEAEEELAASFRAPSSDTVTAGGGGSNTTGTRRITPRDYVAPGETPTTRAGG